MRANGMNMFQHHHQRLYPFRRRGKNDRIAGFQRIDGVVDRCRQRIVDGTIAAITPFGR